MHKLLLILGCFLLNLHFLLAQYSHNHPKPEIVSGPMMGHISYDHARIWVQLSNSGSLKIAYGIKGEKLDRLTREVLVETEKAFSVIINLGGLIPLSTYDYQLILDGKREKKVYSFTTPPLSSSPSKNISFAMGSCVYINDAGIPQKGGDYQIFESIAEKEPDMMLWLGDNVYFHEQDWHSREGMQYRYSRLRQLPEAQNLFRTGAHYAIWDDHDYGPNDSDRSFIGKVQAKAVFDEFWPNPVQHLPGMGTATSFSRADCDFFLLDNRYFRSPQKRVTGKHTILGEEQLEWLIDALCTSEASFKFIAVGGLVLSSSYNPKNQNYISNYSEERTYLLDQIEANDIKNVIFLTGDKHYSEMSQFTNRRGNSVYEITSSSLTASENTREINNRFRVPGSHIQQRNFALVHVKGNEEAREIAIVYYDANGEELWNYKIQEER